MEARKYCDVSISLDCDGQDDISAVSKMIEKYLDGSDVVYGVRNDRSTDTFFKRMTAEAFYGMMKEMGVDTVFNHADYRLLSLAALDGLSEYGESNLFLRGMVPLIGLPSSTVEYSRAARVAGDSHYPLRKMIALAVDGITSLSIKPIHTETPCCLFALSSFIKARLVSHATAAQMEYRASRIPWIISS